MARHRIILAMHLPRLEKPERYRGLYVFDFGDHTGLGFTAEEVAELLESERYQDGKVYKIHKAHPDGKLELKGLPKETFHLEAGMFFYASDLDSGRREYRHLINLAVTHQPPCRAKVHLAEADEGQCVVGLIYPAEFEEEMGAWLLDCRHAFAGVVEGGVGCVQAYYDRDREILERHQLFGTSSFESRTGDELLANLRRAVQR